MPKADPPLFSYVPRSWDFFPTPHDRRKKLPSLLLVSNIKMTSVMVGETLAHITDEHNIVLGVIANDDGSGAVILFEARTSFDQALQFVMDVVLQTRHVRKALEAAGITTG